MSYDAKFLHNLKSLDTPIAVSLPNGQRVQVSHYGTLKLNEQIELQSVLLVPYFKYNLLSVKKLTNQLHCDVIFLEAFCSLQGPSLKRPVVVGKEACGLYLLDKTLVKEVQFSPEHSSDLYSRPHVLHEPYNVSCN